MANNRSQSSIFTEATDTSGLSVTVLGARKGGCSVSVWIALKANFQSITCHGIVAVAVAVVATAR